MSKQASELAEMSNQQLRTAWSRQCQIVDMNKEAAYDLEPQEWKRYDKSCKRDEAKLNRIIEELKRRGMAPWAD